MPRISRSPTLYDELKTVSISFLKRHGYLKSDQWQSGTITWSSNGRTTGNISIAVSTQVGNAFLELNYRCNGAPINYKVQLVSIPSNLGKGAVWFFVCPSTGKRCRKLHCADTYFLHRSAFSGCMYEKQTHGKNYRALDKTLGKYYRADELYQTLRKKHFKKQYAGKPTKRYLRIMRQIERAEAIPINQLEKLLLS